MGNDLDDGHGGFFVISLGVSQFEPPRRDPAVLYGGPLLEGQAVKMRLERHTQNIRKFSRVYCFCTWVCCDLLLSCSMGIQSGLCVSNSQPDGITRRFEPRLSIMLFEWAMFNA